MFSRYLITKEYISDIINTFHNNDCTNPIIAMQTFGMSINIIYWRPDKKVSKSSWLPSNKVLSLKQE